MLHQDNVTAHIALSVKNFIAEYNINVLDHLLYSLVLKPCDFYLLPKFKSALEGIRFQTVEAEKVKAALVIKEVAEEDSEHCFKHWKICMERCR